MIISSEICKLVDGMTITVTDSNGNPKTIAVQNNMDDQEALEKFIQALDERSLDKFPMIFVVNGKNTGESTHESKRQIVIMAETNPDLLSKARNAETYVKVIHPIFEKLISAIDRSKTLTIVGDRKKRVEFVDRSNYGVVNGSLSKKKSNKSTVSEFVDARIVEMTIRYNASCKK